MRKLCPLRLYSYFITSWVTKKIRSTITIAWSRVYAWSATGGTWQNTEQSGGACNIHNARAFMKSVILREAVSDAVSHTLSHFEETAHVDSQWGLRLLYPTVLFLLLFTFLQSFFKCVQNAFAIKTVLCVASSRDVLEGVFGWKSTNKAALILPLINQIGSIVHRNPTFRKHLCCLFVFFPLENF